MKISLKNAFSFYTLLLALGYPLVLAAQMNKAELLSYLASPLAPIPHSWEALSYPAASELGFSVLQDTTVEKVEALLPLLTNKALHSSMQDQRLYLEHLLGRVLTDRPALNYPIWQAARQFSKEAFPTTAQRAIQAHLSSKPQYLDKWLLLAGFATDNPWPIHQVLSQRPVQIVQQAGKLALVRMGQKKYAKNLLRNIKRIPIDDDFVYDLAPLALYTRDSSIVAYLVDIVIKDLGQCHPADAEISGEISCAYRLVELLAPILAGFPSILDKENDWGAKHPERQMKTVRKWLKLHRASLIIDQQHW